MTGLPDDRAAAEGGRRQRGQLVERAAEWLHEGWDDPIEVNAQAVAKRLGQGEELVRLLVAELARAPEPGDR